MLHYSPCKTRCVNNQPLWRNIDVMVTAVRGLSITGRGARTLVVKRMGRPRDGCVHLLISRIMIHHAVGGVCRRSGETQRRE